jgi:hypothetical protein
MRSTLIPAILLSGLFLCLANVSEAAPMGTAFTYQGRLIEGNQTADGLFDLAFKLYDANVAGNKLGNDVNISEVDIIDGYFTADLDFGGGVFDGNAVWLEAGFRPGEQSDPCAYVVLEPRQQITPTPYALYAALSGGVAVPLEMSGSIVSGAIISATNTSGHALYGHVSAGSGVAYGVYGRCDSSDGIGVRGWASTGSGTTTGVYGVSSSTSGHGVYGLASASSGTNYGVYGETNSSSGYAGYFDGRGYFSGNVGIGAAPGSHKLDVVGDAAITGSLYAGSGSTVLFVDDANDNVGVRCRDDKHK